MSEMNYELMYQKERERNSTLERKESELRSALSDLKDIVYKSTISLLWIFRLGILVGVWFFPMPQDRWLQVIGIFGLLLVSHLLSKAVVHLDKIKTY